MKETADGAGICRCYSRAGVDEIDSIIHHVFSLPSIKTIQVGMVV